MSRSDYSSLSQAITDALKDAPPLTEDVGRRLGALLFGVEQ